MFIYLSIITFFVSLVLIYVFMKNAEKLGFIDVPNERSAHKKQVPRSAGIGFVSAVFITVLLFGFSHFAHYYYVYLAIYLIFIVGVIDDKKDVSPRLKFVFMLASTLILYFNDFYITSLGFYFGYEIILPHLLILPFTFVAIAGFSNSLNLMDGLDGLAGSITIIMLAIFLAIGLLYEDELMIALSSMFIATLAAFLVFNWNPAKIFMGDSGSLSLGFVIAVLSIQSLNYITPASVLFIIAVPLLDTFIVITRRLQRGVSPFKADKNHLHHFLYNIKMDVKFTVILIIYIQIAFSIIGYQLKESNNFVSLILFGILFFIFLNLFDQRLRRRRKKKVLKQAKQRNSESKGSPTLL